MKFEPVPRWRLGERRGKLTGHALGAKNIRTELKKHFPWVKFSVTSSHLSIDISWDLGPTTKEVEAITSKYQSCWFNGMEDIEEHTGSLHEARYGGAKYVNKSRGYPDDLREQVMKDICVLQRVEFQGPNTRNVCGNGDPRELCQHANLLLSDTRFEPGEVYAGVESIPAEERNNYPGQQWLRIIKQFNPEDPMARFNPLKQGSARVSRAAEGVPPAAPKTTTTLAAPAPAQVAPTPAPSRGVAIRQGKHTKKGHDIWTARLSERVDKDEFKRVLDVAKAHHGYWSNYGTADMHGFIFTTAADALAFQRAIEGSAGVSPAADGVPPTAPPPAPNIVPVNFQAPPATPTSVPVSPGPATPLNAWARRFLRH